MFLFAYLMVFNATFNNITLISWWSVLLVEETGENKPLTCPKSLTNFITYNVVHLKNAIEKSRKEAKSITLTQIVLT